MYERILVPVDGSRASRRGLDEAVRIAKTTGAVLKLLHVVDDSSCGAQYTFTHFAKVIEAMREFGTKTLEQAAAIVRQADVPCEIELIDVIGGQVGDKVVWQAKVWGADLIVMGTHGRRGAKRLVMGSDAEMVVRSASVPVLLVRDESEVP